MNTAYFNMVYYKPGKYQHCEICGEPLTDGYVEYLGKKKRRMIIRRIATKQCPKCSVMYVEHPVNDLSGILRIHIPEIIQKEEVSRICHEAWLTFHGEINPNIYNSDIMKLIHHASL